MTDLIVTAILIGVILILCIINWVQNSYIRKLEECVDILYPSARPGDKIMVDWLLDGDLEK